MHITALFVTVNNWKPLSCPSTGDWLNKTVIYLCNRISKTLSWGKKAGCRMTHADFFCFFKAHTPPKRYDLSPMGVCIHIIYAVYVGITRVLEAHTEMRSSESCKVWVGEGGSGGGWVKDLTFP